MGMNIIEDVCELIVRLLVFLAAALLIGICTVWVGKRLGVGVAVIVMLLLCIAVAGALEWVETIRQRRAKTYTPNAQADVAEAAGHIGKRKNPAARLTSSAKLAGALRGRSMAKIAFEFDDEKLKDIDAQLPVTGFTERKQYINAAITLFEWCVNQARQGRRIAAVDDGEQKLIEVDIAAFDHARRQAS